MKNPHFKAIIAFLLSAVALVIVILLGYGIGWLLFNYLQQFLISAVAVFVAYQIVKIYLEVVKDFEKHPEDTLWEAFKRSVGYPQEDKPTQEMETVIGENERGDYVEMTRPVNSAHSYTEGSNTNEEK